jgi:hypothetical protein
MALHAAALLLLLLLTIPSVSAVDLPVCSHTSSAFANSLSTAEINAATPCILYDTSAEDELPDTTKEITLTQLTGSSCNKHRDGSKLAVDKINAMNSESGFTVGYAGVNHVRFRLISVVVGTDTEEGFEDSFRTLSAELASEADLVVGTCSNYAEYEKDIVNEAGKILTAQVGPGVYYEGDDGNPDPALTHVFGVHLSSYTYTYPALAEAKFEGAETFAIAGRDASVFFQSTCAKAEE